MQFDAEITVAADGGEADAKSLLAIMSLGLTKGATVEIASEDPEGRAAVDAIAALAESGFGEA